MGLKLSLTKVHDFVPVPGTDHKRLVAEHHYVRLTTQGEPPLYVQDGVVFSEEQGPINPIPGWFYKEAEKIAPEVAKLVGLPKVLGAEEKEPEKPESPTVRLGAQELTAPGRPKMWDCPACGEAIGVKLKGLHIAHHKRKGTWTEEG